MTHSTSPSNVDLLRSTDIFVDRHIGPSPADVEQMLNELGVSTLEQLVDQAVPDVIRKDGRLDLPDPKTETEILAELLELAEENEVLIYWHGLFQLRHPSSHPKKYLGKSRVVHAVHALPGGDSARTSRSIVELSDYDWRSDRNGDRQCFSVGRGNSGRGSNDIMPTLDASKIPGQYLLCFLCMPSSNDRRHSNSRCVLGNRRYRRFARGVRFRRRDIRRIGSVSNDGRRGS